MPSSPAAASSLAESLASRWHRLRHASPQDFFRISGALARIAWIVAAMAGMAGLVIGLRFAKSELLPGEAWRIFFVHVPAAWMSMGLYLAFALASVLGLWWGVRLAPVVSRALVPTGTLMTALAIWTGALWGRPTSGHWWTWDARLAAELCLLAAYLIHLVLPVVIDDIRRAQRVGTAVALAGVGNVVLIHESAHWWQVALPDGPAVASHAPSMTDATLAAVVLTTLALGAWCAASVLHRAGSIVLEDERHAAWPRALPEVGS